MIYGGLVYTVNWAYLTAPDIAWRRQTFSSPIKRFHGHCGIVDGRIPALRYPADADTDRQWRRITTANEAARAMTDVVEQFEDDVWPSILKLNDPSTCLREAERTRHHVFPHPTLRLQLAATGALPDFDQTAAEYLAASDERSAENNQRYVAFLRAWVEDRRARSRIDEN
ncbi:hypothetical protein [Segniliparus rugosus]|uniref:Uncharacterized protein n=1 Tax=Segniliparus rugosus (strain ATCC BAA-974 / DSM 45345 / CCUG 50838 / CIP 108380 / JCM 13579 / CDC 945) TaxID=679197 RepID=E5XR65_SEGRC|nr:hypothetical protein [Segniliparus rugosus]EFV13158.2 hypothetical protein HMPREF9336_01987 [Segniliparus rugosus ATCC BAA-974]